MISFLLWLLVLLLGGLFGGFLHTRNRRTRSPRTNEVPATRDYNTQPVVVEGQHRWPGRAERVAHALHVVSFLLASAVFLNVLANGVTRGFEILVWIFLGVGILWAFARGLVKHFADVLLLAIIALFIAMGVVALRHPQYRSQAGTIAL